MIVVLRKNNIIKSRALPRFLLQDLDEAYVIGVE